MVRVVQTNAEELADASQAGADPRVAVHPGQGRRIQLLQLRQRLRQQDVPPDIGNHTREVADLSVAVEQSGFFTAGSSVSQKLHSCSIWPSFQFPVAS